MFFHKIKRLRFLAALGITTLAARVTALEEAEGGGGTTETETTPEFDMAGVKTIKFVKVGSMVTMQIPVLSAGDSNNSNEWAPACVPEGYRPAASKSFLVYLGAVNGAVGTGRFVVLNDGDVELHPQDDAVFNTGNAFNMNATAISWIVG